MTLIRGWGRFEDDRHIVVSSTLQASLSIGSALNGDDLRGSPSSRYSWRPSGPCYDMFQLERFPERVVVVGAGFIAYEFAGILRGRGRPARATRSLLHGFDSELSSAVQEGMLAQGIDPRFSTSPVAIEGVPGSVMSTQTESGWPAVVFAGDRSPSVPGRTQPASGGYHR